MRKRKLFAPLALLFGLASPLAGQSLDPVNPAAGDRPWIATDQAGYQTWNKVRSNFIALNTFFKTGSADPNGSVTASPPALYLRSSGGSCTTLYVKESGTSTNTGWVAHGCSNDASAITTGTLAVAQGGTNLTAAADDNLIVGNGTTWQTKALPTCNATTGKLTYDTSTNLWACGTDAGAGAGTVTSVGVTMPTLLSCSGSPITTSGTIACTAASVSAKTFVAGPTSGSAAAWTIRQPQLSDIAVSGASTNDVPQWNGTEWVPAAVGAGSGAPTAAQYLTLATDGTLTNERVATAGTGISFTDAGAGSTLTIAANGSAITGLDAGNISAGTLAVARGGTNLTASADDNIMVGNGTTWQTKTVPDCDNATTSKLLYDQTTNAWSCGTDQSSGSTSTTFGIVIDGAGSAITTGVKGFVRMPVAATITKWTILSTDAAATSGSIVVDVWKDTYANYPPTVGDTIAASAKPTLSSASKNENATLTGWTTAVSAGDIIGFSVDSATTVTRVLVEIEASVP